jgi:acetyl esterase
VPLDPDARAYLDQVDLMALPPIDGMTVSEARQSVEAGADLLFGPKDAVAEVKDLAIAGSAGSIPIRIYSNGPADQGGVLVYFHGGGWVFGSINTHDGVCRALARRTQCTVVSVEYRLAPENKFPAAIDDAWASVEWTFKRRADLGTQKPCIAVGGDSSGGNLAAVVALRARDGGLPLCFQLLVYPVTDCHSDTASYNEFATGYGFTRNEMQWFLGHYLNSSADRENPTASPLLSRDLSGVAPALVITCEYDVLRDEAEAYSDRLRAAGVPARYSRYDGLLHGFYRMGAVFRRSQEALDESASALRTAFDSGPTRGAIVAKE